MFWVDNQGRGGGFGIERGGFYGFGLIDFYLKYGIVYILNTLRYSENGATRRMPILGHK